MATDELQRREAELARHRENRGRLAGVYAQFTTLGQGVVEIEERINFGLTYVQKPWLSYGHEVDIESVRDTLGMADDDPLGGLPQASVYVTDWDQDSKGHYVGAWVAITVQFHDSWPADAQVRLVHMVSFNAVAIKNVSPGGIDN